MISRTNLRRPPRDDDSSSSRYSVLLGGSEFRPRNDGPPIVVCTTGSLRGAGAGCGRTEATLGAVGTGLRETADLPSTGLIPVPSGAGSSALATAVARNLVAEATVLRSWSRRSTLEPHSPQNLWPGWLACPQEAHTCPLVSGTLLSVFRRSKRTPHMPQNLFSE